MLAAHPNAWHAIASRRQACASQAEIIAGAIAVVDALHAQAAQARMCSVSRGFCWLMLGCQHWRHR